MTFEHRAGRPHAARPRTRDMATGTTAEQRLRSNHGSDGRFLPGNKVSVGVQARRVVERPERDLLRALSGQQGADLVLDVQALYRDVRKALASTSPMVLSRVAAYARHTV